MTTNLLIWSVLGVLSGAFVQVVFPADKKYLPGIISAGIIGAFVGGTFYSAITIGSVAIMIDPIASVLALIGAVVLVYFIRYIIKADNELPQVN